MLHGGIARRRRRLLCAAGTRKVRCGVFPRFVRDGRLSAQTFSAARIARRSFSSVRHTGGRRRRRQADCGASRHCLRSLLTSIASAARRSFDAGPCAERQGSRPVVVQIASERRRGRTAGRSATAPPQGFHSFWGWPLPGPCSCYLDHCAIRSRERSPFDGKGRAFAREVDDRIRMRRRVGRLARARGPASPLEGLTATVTFVNDSDELYEVRVDGGRWRGRPPSGNGRRG